MRWVPVPFPWMGTSPPTPLHLGDMVPPSVSHGHRISPQEEHKQLSSMLGCEVTSLLCVPVISRATSQVVALACAFNKLSGER